jgi:crotonobetainyl-CoA:carnitine CoA-transferase CaiB-like acyl-CoA transferase
VAVNLRSDQGLALTGTADVLAENFRPGVLADIDDGRRLTQLLGNVVTPA